MKIVVKFGGTSLKNGSRIEKAASSIAEVVEDGHKVAAVASAMGDTTDRLLEKMTFDADAIDRDEIVSMGERTSVRMLEAALTSKGVEAEFIEPGKASWPIKLDGSGNLDEESTRTLTQKIDSMMEERVPVIAGFLAEDPEGRIATLKRGGSDTTAVMLGNYLDADRVVIVTDVEGVLTGDPDVVKASQNVGEISVDELRDLSFRGTEVIAPEALPFKTEDLDVTVVHFQSEDLLESGTSIEGQFDRLVDTRETSLACLTVAGRKIRLQPGTLVELSEALEKENINILTASTGIDSVSFFVKKEKSEEAKQALHEVVLKNGKMASVTLDEDIGVVRAVGGKYPDRPGIIQQIIAPISNSNINIYEMITSASSISIFVDWEDREKTLKLVRKAF